MIGRRTAVAFSLLCALLFSAIAAQSASAAKAVNTTAFTCVQAGGSEEFSDPHCDNLVGAGSGEYGAVAIAEGTTTKIEGVQLTNWLLKSKSAGAAVEVTCTSVLETGAFHNETSFFSKHTVTGNVAKSIGNCTVNKPSKCVVETPIVMNTEFEGVEGLGAGGNEMGIEHKPEGGGGTFFELTFKDKGAEQCALELPSPFPVTGTAVETGAVAPTEKHTGATGLFTGAMTKETLKFGPEAASIESSATVRMHKNDTNPANPIFYKTVT